MKKSFFVVAMATVMIMGSVLTVSAEEVKALREKVEEKRLFSYPVSAQLPDVWKNVYAVSGFGSRLIGGTAATTKFCIQSYAYGSTPEQQASINEEPKKIIAKGSTVFSNFSTVNFPSKSKSVKAKEGEISTGISSSLAPLEIVGSHRVELTYCGAAWEDLSQVSLY